MNKTKKVPYCKITKPHFNSRRISILAVHSRTQKVPFHQVYFGGEKKLTFALMAHFCIKLPTLYICMHLYMHCDSLHSVLTAAPSAQHLPDSPLHCLQWGKAHVLSPNPTFYLTLTLTFTKKIWLCSLYTMTSIKSQ